MLGGRRVASTINSLQIVFVIANGRKTEVRSRNLMLSYTFNVEGFKTIHSSNSSSNNTEETFD